MKKNIYVDVDSTVLSFNDHWEPWLRNLGHDFPDGHLNNHCRLTHALGIEETLEKKIVEDYFNDPYAYSIPALKHAIEPIQRLYSEGWHFVAITACPYGESVAERRRTNLEASLGISFDEVLISGWSGSKKEILSRFEPTVWVEDHYLNAMAGYELGYKTFLIDMPYNQHDDTPFPRVSSWEQIYDAIA